MDDLAEPAPSSRRRGSLLRNCPKCHAVVETGALLLSSVLQISRSLVTDWQVWAIVFGLTVAAGLASGASPG